MSFTFNKETRRSLRERIRDGINLIPGASTVVQAPAAAANIIVGGVTGDQGHNNKGGGVHHHHHQKKSHSVDSTVLQESSEEQSIRVKGGSAGHLATTTTHCSAGSGGGAITNSKGGSSSGGGGNTTVLPQQAPSSPSYLTAEMNSGNSNSDHGAGDPQRDGSTSSRSESVSSCSSSTTSSPSKYRTYVVKPNDTVTSIAASFDCTPTELLRINRLITARVLFPGQVLKIPNKRLQSSSNVGGDTNTPAPEHNLSSSSSSGEHGKPHHGSSSGGSTGAPSPLLPHHHLPVHHHHDPATASILESITYAQRKFLKIKVRHVTDGNGVVSGTLLITPNAVMFDPNVSDPLVIEQGAEQYGVIVPIEYIVGASIWSDICGMRVRGKEAFVPPGPRPLLWGSGGASGTSEANESSSVATRAESTTNSITSEDATAGQPQPVAPLPPNPLSGAEEESGRAQSDGHVVLLFPQESDEKQKERHDGDNNRTSTSMEDSKSDTSSGTVVVEEENPPSSPSNQQSSRLESVTDHPLKESSPSSSSSSPVPPADSTTTVTTWYFCLTIGRPKHPDDGSESGQAQQASRNRRNPFCVTYGQKNTVRPEFWFSVSREQVPELYKYWMFWWPHLYGEVDLKVVSDRGYELVDWDNLDVLESRSGGGAVGSGGSGAGAGVVSGGGGAAGGRPRTSNEDGSEEQSVAQELNELTKESWEMLKQPYAKLSSFITTRGSSIMKSSSHSSQSSVSDGMVGGGTDGGHRQHHHHAHAAHHHAHHHGQQHNSGSTTSIFNSHHFSITNPMNSFFFESFSNISPNHSVFDDTDDDDDEFGSFEQVVTNEELRNLLALGGDEMMAVNLPDLIGGKSEILQEEDMRNLTRHLTARAEGYPWTQVFTSSRDGFSLNSLYRRNGQMPEDSPVMLIVQDTNARVFGALVSCSLHASDSFYGTGQSFLFTLRPEFNVYKWTGENLFFVKGNHDGIWIGAGDGKFGLYVDGDLNCGRTETCQTYGNTPLTDPQDFIIKTLECWAFGNYVLTGGDSTGIPVCDQN